MIKCALGDDNITSYGDTCSFTCNTGYEVTGRDTRTCQSDGSWSGSIVTCERGKTLITKCSYMDIVELHRASCVLAWLIFMHIHCM